MDPLQATMAGILIAREIIHLIKTEQDITEERLAALIASNLVKLDAIVKIIKDEMARYGVEVR